MRATGVRSHMGTPCWMSHPDTLAVTTEFLIGAARAKPSWCGRSSPTSRIARRRARHASEVSVR